MKKPGISIIGAGNVGTQLGLVFRSAGYPIHQICSHKTLQAFRLAKKVNATAIGDIEELTPDADIYILCIPDQSIRDLKATWKIKDKLVCHTSGATEMNVLKGFSLHYGVFYPLQTFSVRKNVNFKRIPVCIESNSPESQEMLYKMAKSISGDVRVIDSVTRMTIHLAAVIAGNFSNFMYVLAEDILQRQGFSFDLLHPLIEETSNKAVKISPFQAQTGPARRKDLDVIRKHLELLKNNPETQQIYDLITKNIINYFQ